MDHVETRLSAAAYGRYLIFIAGMGGLLYGIDIGIITAALLYLGKTLTLSLAQTSAVVAAVFLGSTCSSLIAGFLADLFGRRRMMIASGLMYCSSIGLIVIAQGFVSLFVGRLLLGLSGGVIAVVVPLYLAECLSAKNRGKGSGIFQLMLTIGIVIAAFTGFYYTGQAEAAILAAHGDQTLIVAAESHAWRGMFLSVVYPGLVFFIGSFFLSETPRWLFRRNRPEDALTALRRSCSEEEAQLELHEMQTLAVETRAKTASGSAGSLLQRKYVVPFVLACVILACNQATGINSILSYLAIILKQAGMTARHATQGDLAVKILNCAMTFVAVALVDRKGRKFLLVLGTSGIIVALTAASFVFYSFESKRVDVREQVQARVTGPTLTLPVNSILPAGSTQPIALSVVYHTYNGDKPVTVLSTDPDPVLKADDEWASSINLITRSTSPLHIVDAYYAPIPTEQTGWIITGCIALFIASFSVGPGVVVWLALSELMPTRIRSSGMGIALLLNQAVSTTIAGVFLPVVGAHGYFAMFAFWAGCTVVYFVTAAFFLPETKGRTLEEIEQIFERAG